MRTGNRAKVGSPINREEGEKDFVVVEHFVGVGGEERILFWGFKRRPKAVGGQGGRNRQTGN